MRHRVSLWVLSLSAVAMLAGCRSAVMETPRPSVELPARWIGAEPTPSAETSLAEGWWHAFGSEELDLLVAEALRQNHDLQAAVRRVEAMSAQARIAGAERWPSIAFNVGGNRAKRNFIGFPIPGSEGNVLSTTTTTQSLSLEVGWEVDLWGRLAAKQAAAVAEFEASEADLYGVQLSLAGRAVVGWIGLMEAAQQVELAERTLASRLAGERRVESRYRAGLTTSLDLRLARSESALATSSLAGRQRALADARRQLEILLGRYPAGALEVPSELPPPPEAVPAGLPSELVTRRPDLRAAEMRLHAAGARVDEARRSLYPRLNLTGSGGSSSAALGDLLDGDFSVWSLAGGLLQPLFQGGRLRAGLEFAEASREEALQAYLQSVLESFSEVESALAAEDYLRAQEVALAAATAESRAAEELALRRYSDGLEVYLTVLESQRQSFVSESRHLNLRRDRLLARVNLYLALGGGYGREVPPVMVATRGEAQ